MRPFSLNIKGDLRIYDKPTVMGIVNATPDSLFSGSRVSTDESVRRTVEQMLCDGADFIDVGAYSTRPGCADIDADEELRRLEWCMEALRKVAPDIPVSVDTFRADVARKAVTGLSVDIINDISGGDLDPDMFATVADLHVPYILMHMRGTPQTKQENTDYENLVTDVIREIGEKVSRLELMGVADIILDPGFGFSKTLEQNYTLLKRLEVFDMFKLPLLVGISRKSMITKVLNVTPDEALEGTTALNMYALSRGAGILRVHDVKAARQAVAIYSQLS